MKVLRLQVDQKMAKIQIDSQRAALQVRYSQRHMQVESTPAEMSVSNEAGKVNLDHTSIENNTARRSPLTLQRQCAEKAKASATEGIKEIADDGNYMGKLPNTGNTRGALERQKMLQVDLPTYGRSSVPDMGVKMQGVPGDFSIDWSRHDVSIIWDELQRPTVAVQPKASVNVDLAQRAQIECTLVEETIPAETGQTIDVKG